MKLSLRKVLPLSINENLIRASKIWARDINFDVASKNLILAPSGTGKSTLISLLTGSHVPKSGNIIYNDTSINSLSKDELCEFRKKRLSTVFQDLQLIRSLTGRENILINFPSSDFENNRLDQLISLFRLEKVIDHKTKYLSLGEQQRVAIIRALAKPYKWLLMDEPFSHLDQKNGLIAFNEIVKDVDQKKAGMIMTSLGNEAFIHDFNKFEL